MIIAGTGSRSFVPTDKITDQMDWEIASIDKWARDPIIFMSGMAEGWDEYIARYAIANEYPFIAVVPTETYGEYYWWQKSVSGKNRWPEFKELLAQAQDVIYTSDTLYQEINGRVIHANFIRNQYMVDNADHFLVYDTPSRGKADCLRRIQAAGKPYTLIGP